MIDWPAILQKHSNNNIEIERCRESTLCSLKIIIGSCFHRVRKRERGSLSVLSEIRTGCPAQDRKYAFGVM